MSLIESMQYILCPSMQSITTYKRFLYNLTWNGERPSYTCNMPFDTLKKMAWCPTWGG